MKKMRANVFRGVNPIGIEEVSRPRAGAAGLGDPRIVATLCPGGKERRRRLMNRVHSGRFDPTPLLTHSFSLEQIAEGYRDFGARLDGVMKVAIKPS